MRLAVLLLIVAPLAHASMPECVESMVDDPQHFFARATDIVVARHVAERELSVEQVFRGEHRTGGAIAVAAPAPDSWDCPPELIAGQQYFVVRTCESSLCNWKWRPAPNELYSRFLAGLHRETRESVLATILQWARGALSDERMLVWLETAEIDYDDRFLVDLTSAAQSAATVLPDLRKCEPEAARKVWRTRVAPLVPQIEQLAGWDSRQELLHNLEYVSHLAGLHRRHSFCR